MSQLLAALRDAGPIVDWCTGDELLNIYRSVEDVIRQDLQQADDEYQLDRRIRAFARTQPAVVTPILEHLATRAKILLPRDVYAALQSVAVRTVSRFLDDAGTHMVFWIDAWNSSRALCVLLLMHAVMERKTRTSSRILRAIRERRLVVATARAPAAQVHRADALMILDDVVYSGHGIDPILRSLVESGGLHKRQALCLILSHATAAGVSTIRDSLLRMHLKDRAYLRVACRVPTLFEGIRTAQLLLWDVFLRGPASLSSSASSASSCAFTSYIMQTLGLDDRETLILLPHKVDDMTRVPYKFLHATPALPNADALFKVPSKAAAASIVRAAHAEDTYIKVARHICAHGERLVQVDKLVRVKTKSAKNVNPPPVLAPSLLSTNYAQQLGELE